ncbi:MAG: class I SAM-dependent methyltransferase [Pseudomonadota bacterium]
MPDKAKFWDKTAEKYSRQPIAQQKAYKIKLDLTREYFTPESNVLEFGCGTGSTAILHAPFVKHIHATDVSPEMIRIAKAKLEPEGVTNVTFEVADMDGYSGPAETYDAVMGMNIIHLVDDRMAVMEEVYRLLKPGGHFISSTMCLREKLMFQLMEPLFPVMHTFGNWPHVRRFNAKRLISDVESVGFKTVHQWQPGNGPVLFLVGQKPD